MAKKLQTLKDMECEHLRDPGHKMVWSWELREEAIKLINTIRKCDIDAKAKKEVEEYFSDAVDSWDWSTKFHMQLAFKVFFNITEEELAHSLSSGKEVKK